MITKKIMLGSAQFGMNYGIANDKGQVDKAEVKKILNLAQSMHIRQIDTASAYGHSEYVLGEHAKEFDVITKLLPINEDITDINLYVKTQCLQSLARLRRKTCEGFLVHRAEDLLESNGAYIYESLLELKKLGLTKKIGVSVYSPEQVYALMDKFQFDIIQFPLNILDQRFLQNKLLFKLKNKGIELHARSIFMQGLLLIPPEKISHYFDSIKYLLIALKEECENKTLTLQQALIEFVLSIKEIDYYIVGVDNYQQFNEIIDNVLDSSVTCRIQTDNYSCDNLSIINPVNWKMM